MRRELKSMSSYVKKKDEIKDVKKKRQKAWKAGAWCNTHQVIEHSEQSEKYHAELLAVFEETEKMDVLLPEMAKKIMDARTEADETRRIIYRQWESRTRTGAKKTRLKKKGAKEKADDLLKEFKKGKKISLEELMIIQAGEK